MILQKLPKNGSRFGQINCRQSLQKVAQSPKYRPIWSHSESRVTLTSNCLYYGSRVVISYRKVFIRLATELVRVLSVNAHFVFTF